MRNPSELSREAGKVFAIPGRIQRKEDHTVEPIHLLYRVAKDVHDA